jgi:hypothetical protein
MKLAVAEEDLREMHDGSGTFHRHKVKIIVITSFLLVLAFIIYTSVFGSFSFIGRTVMGDSADLNNSIEISATLEQLPSLSLDGEFKSVKIQGAGSFLYAGNKFPLSDLSNNYIILSDFDGNINFDSDKISKLNGKASEVSVNGASMFPESGETIKVYFDEPFNYNLLEISDGVFIKEMNYKTSGEIKTGGNELSLNEDNILIKNFQGSLTAGDKLEIKGLIESLDITGSQRISVSS